jgi:hypothetical protein
MSVSPLDLVNQTGLVPNSLLGYSSNGQSALEITATDITIAGNLTTTPIYVEISAVGGLTTTNPTGLDVNCDFNMNSNDITNLDTLSSTTGIDLTLSSQTGQIVLNAGDNVNINAGENFTLNTNATTGIINLTGGNTTGSITLDSSQTNINGGLVNITATSTSANISGPLIDISSSSGNIVLTSNNNNISLDASNDITLTTSSGVCNINSFDSVSILSLDSGIIINSIVSSINLLAPTSEVIMTATQATLTDGTGSTTSIAPTIIKVGTQTSGDDLGSISLIGINSTANQAINFSPSNGSSIINNGYINWYNFPMSITFLNKWSGSFSYPFGSPNTWDISQSQTIPFPSQFLHSTWAVSFSINFHSVGSATADKGFACYIDFTDGTNVFTGFTFNQNTPYAQWYNASTYTATSQTPLTFTMTDYFDFTNATSLDIRLNFYGDNPQIQNYSITSAFTLMTLI